MNNALPLCRFTSALITAVLLIPALSASAQTTQAGTTNDSSSGDSGGTRTLVATVFGESLYLEQFTPAEAEVKRKELSPADFDKWLIQYRAARLYEFVWAAVKTRYIEREKIGVSHEEVAALKESVERQLISERGLPDESPFPPLEHKGIAVAWAHAGLIDWKVCKSLYEKHGGRVGIGSLGEWTALDGQRRELCNHFRNHDFQFQDFEIQQAFWRYSSRENFADSYPKGERLRQLLANPPYLWAAQSREARNSSSIVSHVDSYGSGTGSRHELSSTGQMVTGFDYGDATKTDWKGSIKWRLLRREGQSYLYQVEWNYKPNGGAPTGKTEELSFDGVTPAKLIVNEQWVISIEPNQPPAEENKRERIGSALGRDIYRDQLKDNPPTYDQVARLFMAPAVEEFEREHWAIVEMSDDEIRAGVAWTEAATKNQGGAAWEQWQARSAELKASVDQRLAEIKRQLDDPTTAENQRPLLRTALRVTALDSTHPHATEGWLLLHGRKFEKYLHCNYGGGRIIHQQYGPEALDARRKLLQELEKAGKFEITDPELRKLAYDYWERPAHPGGFHTDRRLLMFPWTEPYQEMVSENEGPVPAKVK